MQGLFAHLNGRHRLGLAFVASSSIDLTLFPADVATWRLACVLGRYAVAHSHLLARKGDILNTVVIGDDDTFAGRNTRRSVGTFRRRVLGSIAAGTLADSCLGLGDGCGLAFNF